MIVKINNKLFMNLLRKIIVNQIEIMLISY